ncbi:MAG: fused MFS/spermidine synthase [Candidatus Riflebacteria bacterium]|nr:fused MFS/spermidine synthase [Candidatus Riflebacteria bacterium]
MRRNLFLYATTFICGMAVMAVELSASRLMAPYYGSSMITWTVLIGLVMVALSLGNFLGGRLADRPGTEENLFAMIWTASVWIALIPLAGRYVITASFFLLALVFPESLLLAGVVFSCLAIFAVPCVLLGAATPCLVKLCLPDLDRTGRVAGELYALSTVGSIVGTFVPTFLTIPTIGTARTFLLFALLLNLVADVHYVRRAVQLKRRAAVTLLIVALLAGPLPTSFAFWKTTLYEGESVYNYLQVTATEGGGRALSTHVEIGHQSVFYPDHQVSGSYWEYALAAPLMRPKAASDTAWDGLILGFGAGTFARQARYFLPGAHLTGVEIDGGILALAGQFFGVTPDDARVVEDDARAFLRRPDTRRYDVVFLDAFQDITVPFHLSTREFFGEVADRLATDGVLVVNVNLRFQGKDGLLEHLAQTIRGVLPAVYRFDIPGGLNSLVFAPRSPQAWEAFTRQATAWPDRHPLAPLLREVRDLAVPVGPGPLQLTDEVAPVEFLSQEILDALVRDGLREMLVRAFEAARDL